MSGKRNLYGLDRGQLQLFFQDIGLQAFRGRQMMKWAYHQGITDFADMTDLPLTARQWLTENCCWEVPKVHERFVSRDGTVKWLIRVAAGDLVEMVLIPDKGRNTLCVSSQVGCVLDCSFCSTGKQGFNGNLTAGEIVGQMVIANDYLSEQLETVTNVVAMGMGEPLLNIDAVITATNIMMDDHAFGLSKRRVTVSTAGVVPGIEKLQATTDVSLAISLHAPTDELRDVLVPINKKYPIARLLAACRDYVEHLGPARKLVIEYTLMRGINDQAEHARALAKLLQPLRCKVNLIPFNPFPGSGYERPLDKDVYGFQTQLMQAGFITMVRTTRGDDINAACGQLVGQVEDRTKRQRRYRQRLAQQIPAVEVS
jgi:23S rRNA (adenine2503-C2)-methyltransferase